MKRRWMAAGLVIMTSVGGCQLDGSTQPVETVEQGLEQGSGNFCGSKAEMQIEPYKGQDIPYANPDAGFIVYPDWRVKESWIVALPDLGAGKVVWAVRVPNAGLADLLAKTVNHGAITIPHAPPPPPLPVGDLAIWETRYNLESQLIVNNLGDAAAAAALSCQ